MDEIHIIFGPTLFLTTNCHHCSSPFPVNDLPGHLAYVLHYLRNMSSPSLFVPNEDVHSDILPFLIWENAMILTFNKNNKAQRFDQFFREIDFLRHTQLNKLIDVICILKKGFSRIPCPPVSERIPLIWLANIICWHSNMYNSPLHAHYTHSQIADVFMASFRKLPIPEKEH